MAVYVWELQRRFYLCAWLDHGRTPGIPGNRNGFGRNDDPPEQETIAEPLGLDFYGDLIIRWTAHKLQNPEAQQKDYTNAKPVEGDWTTWSEADLTKNQEQQKQYKLGLDLLELTEDESKKLDNIAAELIAMIKEENTDDLN